MELLGGLCEYPSRMWRVSGRLSSLQRHAKPDDLSSFCEGSCHDRIGVGLRDFHSLRYRKLCPGVWKCGCRKRNLKKVFSIHETTSAKLQPERRRSRSFGENRQPSRATLEKDRHLLPRGKHLTTKIHFFRFASVPLGAGSAP